MNTKQIVLNRQNVEPIGSALRGFLCNGKYFTVAIKISDSQLRELGSKFKDPKITFSSGNEDRGFIFMFCGSKNIGVYHSGIQGVDDPVFFFRKKSIKVKFYSQDKELTQQIYKINK